MSDGQVMPLRAAPNDRFERFTKQASGSAGGSVTRCQELLNDDGLMGMLTMHSFMFISSYENLRDKLRQRIAIQTLAHFGGGLFAVGNPGTLQTAAYVLRREPDEKRREEQVGIYFRLVKEPDAISKRHSCEAALATLRNGESNMMVFHTGQRDFDPIPGKPWAYWVQQGIRRLFLTSRGLGQTIPVCIGMRTGDNARFLRFWWEVGLPMIVQNATNAQEAEAQGRPWVPYMKGGPVVRWYGNQDYVVEWRSNGKIIKEDTKQKYPQLGDRLGWKISNEPFYFRRGVTWSDLATKGFAARLSPGGFIFDVKGSSAFPENVELLLALLNSSFAQYVLGLLNPTVSFQVGDLGRIPMPEQKDPELMALVRRAVNLVQRWSQENEKSYHFVQPPLCLDNHTHRGLTLRELEASIDRKIFHLYRLSDSDISSIKQELCITPNIENGGEGGDQDEGEPETEKDLTRESIAINWVSYAFGAVLGRFEIGKLKSLGCGDFSAEIASAIRKLVDPDGIMAADPGHPQDIVKRTLACLELMLGQNAACDAIRMATGAEGDPEELLRDYLDKRFWKYHFQLYRKRPVYWPLQSPKKKFTVWVFHEKFTKDALFKVRSDFVEPKIRWLESQIKEHKLRASASQSREKREAEKEASQMTDLLDDVQEFAKRLNKITQRGYIPHIDDGVLLNAAPLWELLPLWPETKRAWQELEAGEYDWAQQAMEYWPTHVKEKCKTNKSFAIAHGLA